MNAILDIRGITKRFGGLVAVNQLSMHVNAREIHSLIGPNGSGKTTTINMLNGTFWPTSGQIFFNDTEITQMPTYKIARLGISRTFQNIKLFHSLTALENLMVGAHTAHANSGILRFLFDIRHSYGEERRLRALAEEMLTFLNMTDYRDVEARNLPYGRQKMVEFGRALMSSPKLVLLDEPAAGLNPTERREFLDLLYKTYESGVDLFLIEHNMDVVMNISHRITVLDFGSKIAEGPPAEIQNHPEVIRAYLGEQYKAVNAQSGEMKHA